MIAALLDHALSLHPLVTGGIGMAVASVPVLFWTERGRG